MKKILMIPEGNWLAHVSRPLVFAKVLRSHGFEMLFACSGKHSHLPAQAGFSTHPLFTKEPEYGLAKARRLGSSYDDFLVRKYVESEIECISELKPALVVGDFRITLSISTELLHIPYISILNAYWTNFYSARSTFSESMWITQVLGQRLASLPLIWALVLRWAAGPFNRERRRRGLRPRGNMFDIMASRTLNLLVDAPEFAPTKNLSSKFRYTGPIIWEAPAETPRWLSTLDPKKPIIYLTIGSTGSRQSSVNVLEAFGNTDYQIIVSTGEMVRLSESETPPNFYVADYLPGIRIMEICDLVICHGGNGTIYQALSKGVPVIGIPTMHDQEINMDRIVDLEVGIKLSKRRSDSQRLVKAVKKVLSDPKYLKNTRRFQKIMSKYDAPRTGARLIEDLL